MMVTCFFADQSRHVLRVSRESWIHLENTARLVPCEIPCILSIFSVWMRLVWPIGVSVSGRDVRIPCTLLDAEVLYHHRVASFRELRDNAVSFRRKVHL